MRLTRWAPTSRAAFTAALTGGVVLCVLVVPALGAPTPDPQGWAVNDFRNTSISPRPSSTSRATPTSTRRKVKSPEIVAPRVTPRAVRRTAAAPTHVTPKPPRTLTVTHRATVTTTRPPVTRTTTRTAPATTPSSASPTARTSAPAAVSAGWHSGATGPGAVDGTLAKLRGGRMQIIGVFADTTAQVQATLPALGTLKNYNGDVDIALGGLTDDTPESWAQAAKGAYLNRWRQAARTLRTARAGKTGTVYVRFAHEFNADWFPWRVTSQNVADFRRSWKIFHDVLASEFPQAELVFCANTGGRSNIGIEQMWPGDDIVDVVAVDVHTGWEPTNATAWQQQLDDTASDGSPRGLGAWLSFARRHDKPLAVSRWGLDPGGATTDDGSRVRLMHAFLSSNAAARGQNPAGRVIYDIFFNYANGTDSRSQLTDPRNTNSAQAYRSLTWGTT